MALLLFSLFRIRLSAEVCFDEIPCNSNVSHSFSRLVAMFGMASDPSASMLVHFDQQV